MKNPPYISADAVLKLMWTVPAYDEDDANRIARKVTARGWIPEVTRATFDGVRMWAVNGYAVMADEAH